MPYEPIVPDGQHLGTSHEVDDAVTGHLFDDDNKLTGHAAWRWVDEPDEDYSSNDEYEPPPQLTQEELERAAEVVAVILIGIFKAVEVATPHVKRWWNQTALPTVRTVWKHVTAPRKKNDQPDVVASSPVSRAMFVASATGAEVAVTVADTEFSMNRSEWEHRFRAMLAAGAFKDEQLRILSNARIEDVDALESRNATEQVTPQQFANGILLLIHANPSLLDEETSAELMRVFSARSASPTTHQQHG